MLTDQLISIKNFCESHQIELSFIQSLGDSGLIEITFIEEDSYINAKHLEHLERVVRLYYEMDINVEGIETVTYLLQRINSMQEEITALKNRLRFYDEV